MIVSLAYTLPEIEISIRRKTLFCFDEKGPHGHDSLYPEPILFENHFLQPHKPSIQARITYYSRYDMISNHKIRFKNEISRVRSTQLYIPIHHY